MYLPIRVLAFFLTLPFFARYLVRGDLLTTVSRMEIESL